MNSVMSVLVMQGDPAAEDQHATGFLYYPMGHAHWYLAMCVEHVITATSNSGITNDKATHASILA